MTCLALIESNDSLETPRGSWGLLRSEMLRSRLTAAPAPSAPLPPPTCVHAQTSSPACQYKSLSHSLPLSLSLALSLFHPPPSPSWTPPPPPHAPSRDWYFIAEQPAPAPHLAHQEGCAALRSVLVTVPRVSRSCEHFSGGFDLHLLQRMVYRGISLIRSCLLFGSYSRTLPMALRWS